MDKKEEINFTIYSNAAPRSNRVSNTAVVKTFGDDNNRKDEEKRLTITSIGEEGIVSKDIKKNERLIIPLPEEDRINSETADLNNNDNDSTTETSKSSSEDTPMEVDGSAAAAAESNLKYGLNKMGAASQTEKKKQLPLLMRNRIKGIEKYQSEDEKFKYDVGTRPESASEEAYESMPVDSFGAALLRGMGWEEGKPIGLNSRGLITPIEFVARGHRQGLGAERKPEEIRKRKRPLKQGESDEPPPQMVVPKDADGRQRHYRTLDEQLVAVRPGGINVGTLVGIISGRHDGMVARVVAFLQGGEMVKVRFLSDEEVVVSKEDITEMSKLSKDHPAQRISAASSSSAPPSTSSSSSSSSGKSKSSSSKKAKHSEGSDNGDSRSKLWIVPHIVVRIVSKSLGGGKYYNKRVRVMDVLSRKNVQVMLEDGRILEGVRQNQLETALPKVGGSVLIIGTSSKRHLIGKQGRLLQRDNDKQKAQVQLLDENTVETLHYDDIAEYDPFD
eukprot:TRINITY_DN0_c0_g6_i1.p1 TRINITY_DN0_c0_g6~~TRINITY_DN0_c0_g6_i1.p1  ORF type:complete len:502 (-),score=143.13 TRINITY_DN0_c0_g6_i1:17-1522(-)